MEKNFRRSICEVVFGGIGVEEIFPRGIGVVIGGRCRIDGVFDEGSGVGGGHRVEGVFVCFQDRWPSR